MASGSDFVRYLEAKRSVDDRALDRRVWEQLRAALHARGPDVQIAEVGAGIGTGLARMIAWGLFDGLASVRYLAVEPDEELVARQQFPQHPGLDARAVTSTLQALAPSDSGFDLVVAHAVLDILELETSLDRLVAMARPGGLLYFPITFDGDTIWEPALDADEAVMTAYHDTMRRHGRTGRLLPHALERRGASLLAAGSSDWIVTARDGIYPADESFFLSFLLDTVASALEGRLDTALLASWLEARRAHLAAGELVLIAHQLDVLAELA